MKAKKLLNSFNFNILEKTFFFSILLLMTTFLACKREALVIAQDPNNPDNASLYEDREVEWTPQQLYHALETASSRMTDGFAPIDLNIDSSQLLNQSSPQAARDLYETMIEQIFTHSSYEQKMREYFRKLLLVAQNEPDFLEFRRLELAMYVVNNNLSTDQLFLIQGSVDRNNFDSLVAYNQTEYDSSSLTVTPDGEQTGILSDPKFVRFLQNSGTSLPAIRSYMQYLTCQPPPYQIPNFNNWTLERLDQAFHAQPTCQGCHVYLEMLQGAVSQYNADGYQPSLPPENTWGKLSETEPVLVNGQSVPLNQRNQYYNIFLGRSPILSLNDFVNEMLTQARDTVDECWSRRVAGMALSINKETAGSGFVEEYHFVNTASEQLYLNRFIELYVENNRSITDTLKDCLKYDWCFIGPSIEPFIGDQP